MRTVGGNDATAACADALASLNIKNERAGKEHLLRERGDTFQVSRGTAKRKYLLDWHLKNGGNMHDPARCLRVYYFWDDDNQQVVIGSLPSHLPTRAS